MPSKLTNLVFLAAILVSAYAAPTPAKRDLSTNSCDGQDVEGRKKLFMDNGADVTGKLPRALYGSPWALIQ